MKNILSLLGTITLIGTSATSLVACNTPQEYTKEQLDALKKENQINTTNETIKNNLEGIVPQEKPFNEADNRGYFIIGKADKGIATKYKNNRYEPDTGGIIEDLSNVKCRLMIRPNTILGAFSDGRGRQGDRDDGSYFKAVYRGNNNTSEPNLIVDKDGMVKVN